VKGLGRDLELYASAKGHVREVRFEEYPEESKGVEIDRDRLEVQLFV
jgi:hypothetical protein